MRLDLGRSSGQIATRRDLRHAQAVGHLLADAPLIGDFATREVAAGQRILCEHVVVEGVVYHRQPDRAGEALHDVDRVLVHVQATEEVDARLAQERGAEQATPHEAVHHLSFRKSHQRLQPFGNHRVATVHAATEGIHARQRLRLVAAAVVAAQAHVGCRGRRFRCTEQALEHLRVGEVVGVAVADEAAARANEAGVARATATAVGLAEMDDGGMVTRVTRADRCGTVSRAVVDHNDLDVRQGLLQQRIEAARQTFLDVVGGHDHADDWQARRIRAHVVADLVGPASLRRSRRSRGAVLRVVIIGARGPARWP